MASFAKKEEERARDAGERVETPNHVEEGIIRLDYCKCAHPDLHLTGIHASGDGGTVVDRVCMKCSKLFDEAGAAKRNPASGYPRAWCQLRASEKLEFLCGSRVIKNPVKKALREVWGRDALDARDDAEIVAAILGDRVKEIFNGDI